MRRFSTSLNAPAREERQLISIIIGSVLINSAWGRRIFSSADNKGKLARAAAKKKRKKVFLLHLSFFVPLFFIFPARWCLLLLLSSAESDSIFIKRAGVSFCYEKKHCLLSILRGGGMRGGGDSIRVLPYHCHKASSDLDHIPLCKVVFLVHCRFSGT